MKKIVIILLTILLLLGIGCSMKLFVIGEPVDGNTLAIDVQEQDGQVNIFIQLPDSAMAISNISFRHEGTVMRITLRKVQVSPVHKEGNESIYYEIADETEIWLGGKLIWTAE